MFNPSWNVPVKIMREDILPKVREDNEYLSKHSYTVLSSWVNGNVIQPEEIDWETVTPRNFPYRLQQSPGNSNALGRYKFNTPNGNAIYLHDTPAKSLFNKERRAYSSGCIRVQKAETLAQILLNKSGLEFGDYDYYRQIPETKWVSLRKHVAVHTIYQTAWVNDEGSLNFVMMFITMMRAQSEIAPLCLLWLQAVLQSNWSQKRRTQHYVFAS
uniref:L,D-transpeptidase family protein n=1 Tax=Enterovibrio coralii TaxID=294935 RepID=UPI001E5A77DE|nr:L,D-transpeptidase family protein [Enterovibrio coralii]